MLLLLCNILFVTVNVYQVEMCIFDSVQTTGLAHVGKKWDL